MTDFERMPPADISAEQAVLGACLVSERATEEAMAVLAIDDNLGQEFYNGPHRSIWQAIVRLRESGSAVDQLTVGDRLKAAGVLDEAGGLVYVAYLASETVTAANVTYHARLVRKAWVRRRIIESAAKLTQQAYEEREDTEELLESAESTLSSLTLDNPDDFEAFDVVVSNTLDAIQSVFANKGKLPGISTGFPDIDARTGGLTDGHLILIASRPSVGKTSLGLKIANTAASVGKRVGIFSLEMPKQDLTTRLLSIRSKVPLMDLRMGHLTDQDWLYVSQQVSPLSALPLLIDDRPGLSVGDIRVKCKRWQRTGLDLVVIDYLGLIKPPRASSREQEVAKVSAAIKGLAGELKVPVITLCQLSRKPEQRTDKRPELSDLRDSGSLEADADVVLFIHRPEMSRIKEFPFWSDGQEITIPSHGMAEFIIAKQRNGPTFSTLARWDQSLTNFSPYQLDTRHEESSYNND